MLSIYLRRTTITTNNWIRATVLNKCQSSLSSSISKCSLGLFTLQQQQQQPKYANQYCHYHHHHHHHCHRHRHFQWKNQHPQSILMETFNTNQRHLSGNSRIVSFNLSDIGEGISEVIIKEWFVKIGDHVQQFDNICEVQSDKASVTITSRYDGQIQKIYYQVDDTAKVGLPLIDILIDSEDSSTESEPENQKIIMNGDEQDNIVAVDGSNDQQDYLGGGKIITTPAVRRMAIEHKVDLNNVIGTGKDGRILKEDIFGYLERMSQQQQPTIATTTTKVESTMKTTKSPIEPRQQQRSIPNAASIQSITEDRIEPFSSVTKGMFKTMTKSLSVPHFGLSEEIDLSSLVELRPEMKKISADKNVPISFMPFFIKAASLALMEYPLLNSTIDLSGEKIIYRSAHNIGIAMDTKQGLLVPNIKNVNQMSIIDVANELNRLQQLGQKGQLGMGDLSGGTFTLSNIGSIGGIFGIPVLMPGEVAIGAIGRIRKLPRFIDDQSEQIRRAHIIQVLWSADHRIIDGATMTLFCMLWKEYLENPFRIFL
nr:lipoamide acyltransferase component of branched-chain alpha-keto acid dehydrogenase complex, mitochondrial-like [Dermatophagoides farinae]